MSEEEKKAIEYFENKIKNKLPLYEETYVDGKPYRRNILQLETNFTEEQANKTEIILKLISTLILENKELKSKVKEKIEEVFDILDTKPYVAYTLYGDELFDSSDIKEVLQELLEENKNE